ncbi:MAG: hypothetical protein RLZZ568_798, partial [Cyanobacteriota bacterium]
MEVLFKRRVIMDYHLDLLLGLPHTTVEFC